MTRESEILDGLYENTLDGNAQPVVDLTNEGLALGMSPMTLLFDAMIPALRRWGVSLRSANTLCRRC
ncbi:MAG: hypothetical protein R3A44_22400 [Caldilineaceae bacterium]